jgi:aconitate hydratase 2/2-methylisocitrate dehydratase
MEQIKLVNAKAADVYRYMNFDQIAEFKEAADTVTV